LLGHIEFQQVNLTYPSQPDIVILKDLNLSVARANKQHHWSVQVVPGKCGMSTFIVDTRLLLFQAKVPAWHWCFVFL
jgi:ABC-type multidrug transport system fused ATPase/permease subunit